MAVTSAASINAVCGVFAALAVILVCLRFYVRQQQKQPYLADDWLMILAVVAYLGAAICVWIGVDIKVFGYSKSQFTAAEIASTAEESSKLQVLGIDLFTILCLGATKTSALCFYRRIFCAAPHMRTFTVIVITSIVIIVLWVITFEFLAPFQCHLRFSALWTDNYNKDCTYSFPFLYGLVVSDVILDIWVLALPIPVLLRLHTTLVRKLSIIGIFMLALVGLGASIARMVVFLEINHIGPVGVEHTDGEHVLTRFFFYYILECGMSIVAVNLPPLWPLFFQIGPETMLRMARSVTSLASGSSLGSNRSQKAAAKDGYDTEASATRADSEPASSRSINIHGKMPVTATGTHHDDVPNMPTVPDDKIFVEHRVRVSTRDEEARVGEEEVWEMAVMKRH